MDMVSTDSCNSTMISGGAVGNIHAQNCIEHQSFSSHEHQYGVTVGLNSRVVKPQRCCCAARLMQYTSLLTYWQESFEALDGMKSHRRGR